jgi:hypothetical protein
LILQSFVESNLELKVLQKESISAISVGAQVVQGGIMSFLTMKLDKVLEESSARESPSFSFIPRPPPHPPRRGDSPSMVFATISASSPPRATIMVPGLPPHVIATMPLLEDWGIACRLASQEGYPGCFDGFVTELAAGWIEALGPETRNEIEIFACGPTPMLKAVQALAARFAVPAQVSLEEYMACAVGGCAGCTVEVQTADGPAMKRVCVDGPVFDAYTVFA